MHSVFVWTLDDVLGVAAVGIVVLVAGVLIVRAAVLDALDKWRERRRGH